MALKEKTLLTFLGCIFISQVFILGLAVDKCFKHIENRPLDQNVCPELGKRSSNMFAGMTATVLALLTGVSINGSKRD
jgi:hypothetical protein